MGPGSALPQYLSTPPRPPDPSNFGLYGGSYSRSDCYRLQGTHQFHSEFTQFSSQPSYPPPPPSETIINGYVFPHQFPHLSANCTQLSANAPPPPPPSSAHHYHFQSYHFQQPTPPTPSGHYPPPPPIVPIPQDTPHHPQYSALHLQQPLYQYQPPALIGHPTTPLSPLPPYHVASVYPNPQHELLNPPVNYPHSDSSISHHQTQSKATIISQSTLSSTYGSVFSGDRDGTPTTKRLEPIRVNQNLRIRSQILRKRKPLSKLARRSRTRIHGDSKMDRCGALLTTSAEPDAFYVLVETSPTRSKGNSSAFAYTECQNLLVSESTPKHLKQKTHMVNQVDMLELNSQLMQLVKICNVKKARKMFDKRPKRDAVSWTSMISGYVRVSDSSKALALFSNMWVQPGLCMDPFLLSITLRACGLGINLSYGEAVHVYLAKSGIVNSVFVGIALLDLYMKVVGMEKGCIVFDKMLLRNVVSGTTIITGEIGEQVQIDEDTPGIAISTKGQWNDKTLDSCQPSQADWIKRYVEQQEEDESSTWEDDVDDDGMGAKAIKPRSYDVIAKEYYAARLEAAEAKQQKDKKNQERAGKMIRDLKQELAALGLSDDILASEFEQEQSIERAYFAFENTDASSKPYKQSEGLHADELKVDGNDMEQCSSIELPTNSIPSDLPVQEKIVAEEETTDMEIGNFFLEDAPSNEFLTPTILELQKKEKFREMRSEKNLEKLDGIWKKGDPQKIPKVIFQQLCQKSGWEAAKFNKVRGKDNSFSYTISVLRKASGRGESRRAGGLVTLQLPDHDVTFNSAEDAQNRVEAYALCQLFPDLPIHLVITEPYDSPVVQWKEGETITNVEDSVKDRRATFLDSLLKADGSTSTSAAIVVYDSDSLPKVVPQLQVQEPRNAELNPRKDAESSYLRQELENKHKKQKFKEMLKARVALPIAGLKGDILQLLQDNNVLVVCGETGSGKTTQVPQFILDDMIQSGRGGHCNIICTQPWRIATISVADRVADESCEPSPGSNGSLVGYQVRLDNASNEKTKLLFCTTEGRTHPVTTSYDKKHTEREFGVGDWVYLKLQPYKQHSMHKGEFHKLSQMYYRPFQVVERVGKVAYILQLPVTAKIHDVFHVSLLKKKLGNLISTQPQLPHIIDPENPKWEPFAVLDRRVLKKRGAVINQWLVQWLGTTPDEATWEDVETILLRYLALILIWRFQRDQPPIEIDFLACLNLGSSSV